MFEGYPGATIGGFGLALLPAALRWWWGRALARAVDDPLIPERLAAHKTRSGIVLGACAAMLFIGLPSTTPFTTPLLMVAYAAGGFPLRKTLYGETWSLAVYLTFLGRLVVAVFGLWMCLALLPWLSQASGNSWTVTLAGAAMLAIWARYHADVTRRLLRTEPIADTTLLEQFQAIVAKTGIEPPRFECVRMNGGVLANALALPSLRGASVIFTDTLLSRLGRDEIIAICAHEVAHLEYYDRKRMRRFAVLNYVLIALAAIAGPLSVWWFPPRDAYVGTVIFPAAMFIAMAARGRNRQRNETASDLRAVELTGNPEALVSGLTALHTIGRVPRRWDVRREQNATHPSLARRLRDIRAASGLTAPSPDTVRSFAAATGGSFVTFEATHLAWKEHEGATHLLSYDTLSELRLHASPSGGIALVAVERQGRRWQMTPRTEDRQGLQALLDQVDGRLTHEAPTRVFSALVTRMVAGLTVFLCMLVAQFAVAFVALLAVLSAVPAFLNATAFAAFVAGAVLLRDTSNPASLGTPVAVMLFVLGSALLLVGRARRGQTSRMSTPFAVVLACCALVSLGAIALGGLDPIRLHQGARGLPEATVFLVGLASACWTWRRKALRYASLTAALAGAATTILSTSVFLDAAGRDPFLVSAPPLEEARSRPIPIAELDVPFEVGTLLVSPHGELVAVTHEEDEDLRRRGAPVFYAGRPTGELSPVEALDFVFVDDRRAMALASAEGGLEVREIVFDAKPRIHSREVLAGFRTGELRYRSSDDRWVVLGRNDEGRFVRAEGTPGVSGTRTSVWGPLTTPGSWLQAVGTKDAAALVVEERYRPSALSRLARLGIATGLGRGYYSEVHINRIVNGTRIEVGRSLLETHCDALETEAVLCAAYDGTRTRVVTIDPQTSAVHPVATVDGRFWTMHVMSQGWIVGWGDLTPLAVRVSTRETLRPPSNGNEFVSTLGVSDGALATAASTEDGSHLRVYRTAER